MMPLSTVRTEACTCSGGSAARILSPPTRLMDFNVRCRHPRFPSQASEASADMSSTLAEPVARNAHGKKSAHSSRL
eukprot:1523973-Rhodomonas_salina.1